MFERVLVIWSGVGAMVAAMEERRRWKKEDDKAEWEGKDGAEGEKQ